VAPALTGIYAGNTANLSIAAVFPKIVEMEREHGSLAGAFIKTLTGRRKARTSTANDAGTHEKPRGSIFSFAEGLETLPLRLAQHVSIKYQTVDIHPTDARAIVLALPAYRAGSLVQSRSAALAALLNKVEYAPMVIAAVSVPDYAFKQPLHGFGFLVPREQGLHVLGALFSSALFIDRAPKGRELLTCFVGGMFEPEAIDWPDDRVWQVACTELKASLELSELPTPVALFRHRRAIPQYNIGHLQWVAAVRDELKATPGLFIASNYLDGISVPACIEQGDRTAHAVVEYLGRKI
jgi:oxygen-dependent protoporphyrinogen oxidase